MESWDIVKEATDLLLTKSIVKDLELRFEDKEIMSKRTNWLKSSNYALSVIGKNIYGSKVKNDLFKAVYYLRCKFYWKRKENVELENELENVIFEKYPHDRIFNFIQGSLYLRKTVYLLSEEKKDKKKIIENLNLAFVFFNKAYDETTDEEIKVAVKWNFVWMYYILGKKEEFEKEMRELKKISKNITMSSGWKLWIDWFGGDLNDKNIVFLTGKMSEF